MPDLGIELGKITDTVGTQFNTMVTNIRDRYFRSPVLVDPLNLPEIDTSKNLKRGMLIPMLSIGEDLPVSNSVIFQFNPDEITYDKSIVIASQERTGYAYEIPFWVRGGAKNISFKLLLDATAASNYRNMTGKVSSSNSKGIHINTADLEVLDAGTLPEVQKMEAMQLPTDRKNKALIDFTNGVANVYRLKQFSTAPFIIFSYGNIMALTYLAVLGRKDVLFNKSLNPIRTELDIQLRVIEAKVIDTNFVSNLSSLSNIQALTRKNDTR